MQAFIIQLSDKNSPFFLNSKEVELYIFMLDCAESYEICILYLECFS